MPALPGLRLAVRVGRRDGATQAVAASARRCRPAADPAANGDCGCASSWGRAAADHAGVSLYRAAVALRRAAGHCPSCGDACACGRRPRRRNCQGVRLHRSRSSAGSVLTTVRLLHGSCRCACVCHDGKLAFPCCQHDRTPHRLPALGRSKGLPRSMSISPRKISNELQQACFGFVERIVTAAHVFANRFFRTGPRGTSQKIFAWVFAPADLLFISRSPSRVRRHPTPRNLGFWGIG